MDVFIHSFISVTLYCVERVGEKAIRLPWTSDMGWSVKCPWRVISTSYWTNAWQRTAKLPRTNRL